MLFIDIRPSRSNGPIRALLPAALACLMLCGVAHAAGDKAERPAVAAPADKATSADKAAPADPWMVNCTSAGTASDLRCQASQNLTEKKTGQRVLTVTVRKEGGEKDGYAMLFALPHGLFLPAGVSYRIDGGPEAKAAIQTSDRNGTYAVVAVSDALLTAMKAGTKMDVGMQSVSRKTVVIPVSLSGFTAAVDKLRTIR